MNTGYRVGVDVGGTFTDIICVTPDGDIVLDKTPTTLEDQSVGVMNGLGQLARALRPLAHRPLRPARHPRARHHDGRQHDDRDERRRDRSARHRRPPRRDRAPALPQGADLGPVGTGPVADRPPRARIPIPERVDFEGTVLKSLDEDAVRRGVRRLKALGVRSIAVMYLFSFVNPAHERRTREIVLEEFPDVEHISLSHEVMPRGPEYERVSTTLVNAYVAPTIARYVGRLEENLRSAGYGGPLLIMQSTGGVMPPDYVARRAVSLLASGPTGGVMGATVAAEKAGIDKFVAVDMGGTSFDLCLVRDGQPEIKTDWNWRYRYYIGLPMVDVQSVGAGGGSIARVRQGALLVGPESAGSVPGPVCYGRGGTRTDRHRRRRGARLSPRRWLRRGPHAPRPRRGARRDREGRRRAARDRRDRGRVGYRTHRQLQYGERDPQGARRPRSRRPPAVARSRTAGTGPCTRGRSQPSSASTASSCPRPRRPSPRWACSSPTTSSTSFVRTSRRCRRSTSNACAR